MMRLGPGKDRLMLAQTFREIRELIGLSQPAYARLFEVERALVQELEEGQLPAALDNRLLKFMLMAITLCGKSDFISTILAEMKSFYGLDHIFEEKFPLLALYEKSISADLERCPWIAEPAVFRCKAIERKRIGCFLLLWAEQPEMHQAVLNAISPQMHAFINFINRRTVILMPAHYLFLDLNTSLSTNPVVRSLELKLEKREPIGFALPRQKPSAEQLRSPNLLELDQLRLFAYSQEAGMLREAEQRNNN